MKKSKYNFFFDVDGNKYVFNAMTCALAEVDSSFEENLEKAVNGEKIDSKLLNDMKKDGVIVEDYFDELEYLKIKNFSGKFRSSSFAMTIAPTMMCNFACPYCYENPQPLLMKDEVAEAILKKVKNAAESKKSVRIVWFGGEPLLAQNVIWNLSEKIIDICEKNGVSYKARMISNCYLASDDVVKNMIKYKIGTVQVTIDGTPDIHNTRRKLKNSDEPTFERILANVKYMSDSGIDVNIRVNVDRTNIERVSELIPELKKYGLEKCTVYLGKVTDSTEVTARIADICLDTPEYSYEAIKWYEALARNGFDVSNFLYLYPRVKNNYCMADCSSSFAIDGNGNLYKCWHDIGNSSKIVGNILDKNKDITEIQKQFSVMSEYQLWNPFKFKKCKECNLLPVCMGGCPSAGIRFSEPDCIFWKYNLIESLKLTVKYKNK